MGMLNVDIQEKIIGMNIVVKKNSCIVKEN